MTSAAAACERVLLVGFMGSGKSTVGRLVAEGLGWTFIDFDERIETSRGLSISRIFEVEGEAAFRELERRVAAECLAREAVVLASGGGWAAFDGNWENVPSGTLSVWLDVSPEEAVRRCRAGGDTRPLLAVEEPFDQARTLLESRRAHYARAARRLEVDDRTPAEIAAVITSWVVPENQ